MKKINKIILALVIMSSVAFGVVAESSSSIEESKRPVSTASGSSTSSTTQRYVPGSVKTSADYEYNNCKVVIGTITQVDPANDMLQIKNSDGKYVWVRINPFTVHEYLKSLSDLRTGDWVMIDLFNTDTSVLEAETIRASRPKTQSSSSSTKKTNTTTGKTPTKTYVPGSFN